MCKAITWLLFFSFIYAPIHSQGRWESKYMRGFLVPHNEGMTDMMSHINYYEFGREWRIDSGGITDKRQHKPVAGIALHYFDLYREINGKSFGFNAFYEAGIPVGKNASIRARLSVGIGYLSKDFNIFTDPKNRAIGSKINGFMQVLGYYEFQGWKHWLFEAGLGMSHYSNGNWSMPNLGINMPGLIVGFKHKDANNRYVRIETNRGNQIKWEFSLRAGNRQMTIDDPRNIGIYMGEILFNYPHNMLRNWRGGINFFYDRTYQYTKFQPLPAPKVPYNTEFAIVGGHEYRINRVGFVTDLGFYLYRPDHTKRMYFEGVGIKYYMSPNWVLMTRLKAHLTSADYFEWGLSYQLNSRTQSRPGFIPMFKWFFRGLKPVSPE